MTVDCRDLSLFLSGPALWTQDTEVGIKVKTFLMIGAFFSKQIIAQKLKHIFFFCGQIQ